MKPCNRCEGDKFITVTLRDLSGKRPHGLGVDHVIACPQCDGKGFITEEDRDRYYRGMGV